MEWELHGNKHPDWNVLNNNFVTCLKFLERLIRNENSIETKNRDGKALKLKTAIEKPSFIS